MPTKAQTPYGSNIDNLTSEDLGVTVASTSHTHSASDVTSGTFDNARISAGNITQHQASLSITESQISDLGTYLTSVDIADINATGTPSGTTYLRGDGTWSTAGGSTNSFETIAVSGQSDVVADSSSDTLTLVAGSNITITTNATTDTITIAASGGGGLSDTDYGDITVSGSGTVMTIDNDVVTYAKMQNVSATDKVLGRSAAGAGDVEEITCTAAGRALIDDADASAQRTTLGLGTLATQSGTFSGTSSGTNTGDQNIFQTIAVSGQSDVVADTTADTLTLVAGTGISITTDAGTDTITITNSASSTGPTVVRKTSGTDTSTSTNSTTPAGTVTGLDLSMTANKIYLVEYMLLYDHSDDRMLYVALDIPAGASILGGEYWSTTNAGVIRGGLMTGDGTSLNPISNQFVSSNTRLTTMNAIVDAGTSGGTLTVKFSGSAAGTSSIYDNSIMRYQIIN